MKINWKVRLRNKLFLSSLVSQTAILIQGIIAGLSALDLISVDLSVFDHWVKVLIAIIEAILFYLAFLGVIIDPTVEGVDDSIRALKREKPLKKT